MPRDKPQIIVRRVVRRGHGGHHGGSWKVAYADFVTAMMAFFMVMWIMGMDEEVRRAIEGYFSNPVGMKQGYSTGASPISTGSSPAAVRTTPIRLLTRAHEERRFRELGARVQARLRGADGLGPLAGQVDVVLTDQGLRIELVESGDGETFFALGSAELRPAAARALDLIAAELRRSGAPVVVEGHTDGAPFGSRAYSNWELSTDRANAARRRLEASGLDQGRIREVRGYADTSLRDPDDPLARANRRTTVLLPFTAPVGGLPATGSATGAATGPAARSG